MALLQQYYEGHIQSLQEGESSEVEAGNVADEDVGLLEERIVPRKHLPPLLMKLSERKAEHLDYLGVSYGMTSDLLRLVCEYMTVPGRGGVNPVSQGSFSVSTLTLRMNIKNVIEHFFHFT